MRPTRWRDLALAAIAAGAIAYLVTRLDYVNLPSPSVYSLLWIPLLAIAEVYIALVTRSRLAGRHGTRPINPLVVVRIAALAKATALVGALALGAYAGFFGWVVTVSSDHRLSGHPDRGHRRRPQPAADRGRHLPRARLPRPPRPGRRPDC